MQIALNPANKELFSKPARYYYSIGGRWSAKTYDSIQTILYRLIKVPGSRACFMRKHYANIKESLYADTLGICRAVGVAHRALKSPLEIQLDNGSVIIFRGLDDPEKSKGLADIDIVLIDEANEFEEMDFETIDQSIRGKHQENSIYLAHNPVPVIPGDQYWFQKLFQVEESPGTVKHYYDDNLGSHVATLKSTYRQNLMCPEHVKKRLEGYKNTNPDLYRLWALGEYAEVQGLVFDNIDYVDKVPDGLDEPEYGLDFGYSNDPAACLRVWRNSTDIWIQGVLYSTLLTNKDLYAKLTEAGLGEYAFIVADSAEPKSIRDLYDRGFRRIKGVKKGAHYKEDTVQVLRGYNIHVVNDDINARREFSTYSWQRDKDGHQIPKLQDGNDHYVDCLIMWARDRLRVQRETSFYRR